MVYEKLEGFQVDVQELQNHFYTVVAVNPPVMQCPAFGGWSIQSGNGSYKDGWAMGHRAYDRDPVTGKDVFNAERARSMGLLPTEEYKVRTEICTGYLAEVMDRIEGLKLHPRRARFTVLTAQQHSARHRDAADDEYAIRLHIPIISNEACVFATDEAEAHMPADGSAYIVAVNRMHQIFNRSDFDRVHIIMNVWDTTGTTKHHRKPGR
jgi:hypothetical protein